MGRSQDAGDLSFEKFVDLFRAGLAALLGLLAHVGDNVLGRLDPHVRHDQALFEFVVKVIVRLLIRFKDLVYVVHGRLAGLLQSFFEKIK